MQNFTVNTIKRGSWYAHSEMVLQALLCSKEETDRRFAVNKIIEVREQKKQEIEKKTHDEINKGVFRIYVILFWVILGCRQRGQPPLAELHNFY